MPKETDKKCYFMMTS